MYYTNCYSWPFGGLGGIVETLFWVLVVVLIIRLVRGGPRARNMNWRAWRGDTAEDLLKERFVKGEISKEEYEEKLRVIHGSDKKS